MLFKKKTVSEGLASAADWFELNEFFIQQPILITVSLIGGYTGNWVPWLIMLGMITIGAAIWRNIRHGG